MEPGHEKLDVAGWPWTSPGTGTVSWWFTSCGPARCRMSAGGSVPDKGNHGQGCPCHTGARRRRPPGARTARRAIPACRIGCPCAAQAPFAIPTLEPRCARWPRPPIPHFLVPWCLGGSLLAAPPAAGGRQVEACLTKAITGRDARVTLARGRLGEPSLPAGSAAHARRRSCRIGQGPFSATVRKPMDRGRTAPPRPRPSPHGRAGPAQQTMGVGFLAVLNDEPLEQTPTHPGLPPRGAALTGNRSSGTLR